LGYLEQSKPIIGYILVIAIVMTLSTLAFMGSAVSNALASSAAVMAGLLVLVALMAAVAVFEHYGTAKHR
jgi:hypothetical protein